MSKLFLFLYDFFGKRKALLYGIVTAIFAVALFFTSRIHFEEDITQFIPDDEDMKTANAVFRNIKVRDRLVVHLTLSDNTAEPDPDLLIGYCDSLAQLLSPLIPDYTKDIVTRTSDGMLDEVYELVSEHLPIFLEEKDYAVIDSMLRTEAIASRLQNNYNTLTGPGGFAMRRFIADDPLGVNGLALRHLQRMQPGKQFDNYHGYFFTPERRHLLFFLIPAGSGTESARNSRMIDCLDEGIAGLQTSFPGVSAEYYGGPAVSVCNARQIKRDTMITLNITLVAIVIFIVMLFHSKRTPLLMLLPVLFGAVIAMAMLYFIKGTVSAITVGAGSIVVGIALNYSMHVISHLRHAASPREVVSGLASPLTLGSFTTVGAFLGLTFAKSQALADFGLFAAFCLAGSALFCLVVLPHMLSLKVSKEKRASKLFDTIERIASYQPEKQRVLLIFMGIATIVCLFFTGKTRFDSDMMHLNYVDAKLQKAEKNLQSIMADSAKQTIYLVSTGANLQDAETNHLKNLDKIKQLQKDGIVTDYTSADMLLLPETEQEKRITRWEGFWTPERKARLSRDLYTEGKNFGFSDKAFISFLDRLDQDFQPYDITGETWAQQGGLLSEWLTQAEKITMIMSQVRVPNGEKAKVYERLDGTDNLVIFDRSYFASKFVRIISDDFYLILFISSFIVFFALWISYGRIELTLMTFAPMALSWIWITGFMGMSGISFNIVNIIISTFIFGLGDDYSIFITDGLSDEYCYGRKTLPAHKTAIFLSAFAMIVGTGVLIFARHPALRSIATVSTIGMLSVVVTAYTVQPFLFRFFISGRTAQGKYPYTLSSLLVSIYVFGFFGLGSIVLSILSLFLKIVPAPSGKKKYWLHWLMSKLAKSVLYCYPSVKKRFSNPYGETFSSPAIIVANHQSFLDILCLLALHPRIIMLVNRWVWRSPVFGILVRNAGFYPVDEGYENSVEQLQSLVVDGYFIAVFPEGQRSSDSQIQRFHNGAFYLANKLQLDIIPVTLYGQGMVMPKTDPFNVRKGWINVEIMQRIDYQELQQRSIRENAQFACNLIRECYAGMQQSNNDTNNPWFRQRLITNFIYKGPVLEWYLRIKLRMENNYCMFDKLIPRNAVITDIGCGYGFLAYMLAFLSGDRKITGIDYDDEKISIASHCFARNNRQLTFLCANAADYTIAPCDVFILSDVLHYLSPDKQQELLQRCVNSLNPGGRIIIRDADRSREKVHRLTRLTEFFSTRLFQFNKTTNRLYFLSDDDIKSFATRNGLHLQSRGNDRYTSNMVYMMYKDESV